MKSDISPLFFLFISVVYDGEEAIQSISACNDPVNFFFNQTPAFWESWLLLAFPLGC